MSKPKVLAAIVAIVFVAVIVYGFILLGSPSLQRAIKLDEQRVNNLQNISYAIDSYWERNRALPGMLNDLQGPAYWVDSIQDPLSGEPYEYRAISEKKYELCATFQSRSKEQLPEYPRPFSQQIWDHEEGRSCFQLEAQERLPAKI